MATGVLVIGLGSGTKVMSEFLAGSKKYRASALLGAETDTQDHTGTVLSTADVDHVKFEMLQNVLPQFSGNIEQVPPMYSALKIGGRKLCDLARKGEIIKRRPRPIVIHSIQLISTPEDLPRFDIEVECSGGTYVRTIISKYNSIQTSILVLLLILCPPFHPSDHYPLYTKRTFVGWLVAEVT